MNTVTKEGSLYYTAIKREPEKTLCAHDTIQHHWAEKGVLQFTCLTRKRNNVLLLCNTHQLNKPRDWSNLTTVTLTDSGSFFCFYFAVHGCMYQYIKGIMNVSQQSNYCNLRYK